VAGGWADLRVASGKAFPISRGIPAKTGAFGLNENVSPRTASLTSPAERRQIYSFPYTGAEGDCFCTEN
jgi:hypothetical protein